MHVKPRRGADVSRTGGFDRRAPRMELRRPAVLVDSDGRESDVLILAAPHRRYADLRTDVPLVDMWGLTGRGVRV